MAKMISKRGLGDGGAIVSCCSQVVQKQEQQKRINSKIIERRKIRQREMEKDKENKEKEKNYLCPSSLVVIGTQTLSPRTWK